MSAPASWHPLEAAGAIVLFSAAPDSRKLVALPGDVFADALVDTLARMEAARFAGVVRGEGFTPPPCVLGYGREASIGARNAGRDTDPGSYDLATIYLGSLGAVRLAHEQARRAPGQMGALPVTLVIALTAVGIAAVAATAWYAKERHASTVHVEGQTARAVAVANVASTMAGAAIAAGQPIPPDVAKLLAPLADYEQLQGGSFWPAVTGAALAAALAGAGFAYVKGRQHGAR